MERRLRPHTETLRNAFDASGPIRYLVVDDLLPEDLARAVHASFPSSDKMLRHVSLRESKSIAVQMNRYERLAEEILYAFQQPEIVDLVGQMTGLRALLPDANLYAGGLSSMRQGDYLNPHIDNSHDKDRQRWRVLNLLYYVTPEWPQDGGGSLELWPAGLSQPQIEVPARFNRLVIMETHQASWHSVSPVQHDGVRTCVSNYFFSDYPARDSDEFHVTFFRGRPGKRAWDLALLADGYTRTALRKLFKKGVRENPHVYKPDKR